MCDRCPETVKSAVLLARDADETVYVVCASERHAKELWTQAAQILTTIEDLPKVFSLGTRDLSITFKANGTIHFLSAQQDPRRCLSGKRGMVLFAPGWDAQLKAEGYFSWTKVTDLMSLRQNPSTRSFPPSLG